jgi:hypothetical protein
MNKIELNWPKGFHPLITSSYKDFNGGEVLWHTYATKRQWEAIGFLPDGKKSLEGPLECLTSEKNMTTALYWSNKCLQPVTIHSIYTMKRMRQIAMECFYSNFLYVYPAFYNMERMDKVCFQMIFRSSIFIMDIERFMSRMNVDALSVHFKSIGQNKFKMTFIIKDLKLA